VIKNKTETMESSPYARVFEEEGRTPMLWNRDHGVSEDLSMSLFNGFDTVLNERDEKIDAEAIPPEPEAPGPVDQSQNDAYFWSSK
jgi:hypothetical protein